MGQSWRYANDQLAALLIPVTIHFSYPRFAWDYKQKEILDKAYSSITADVYETNTKLCHIY